MPEGLGLVPAEAVPAANEPDAPRCRRSKARRFPPVPEWLLVGAVVWSLFLVACVCPAFATSGWEGERITVGGWKAMLLGWVPPACVPWLANPLLLCGWLAYGRGWFRAAAGCGVAAATVGFSAFAMPRAVVEHLLSGYYVWQACLVVFAAAACRHWLRQRQGYHRNRGS